jgi:predicted GIY-YIG superfamily endonuclease
MYYIYYLTSIFDNYQPRYVGYTSCLERRLSEHVKNTKKGKLTHKLNWIKSVISRGDHPSIVEIERVSSLDEALEVERVIIENFKKWYSLTNSTNGGEKQKVITDNVKKKISNSLKEYHKYNKNWNWGMRYKYSKERNDKRREKIGDKICGTNNSFWGKKHKRETLLILSKKSKIYNYTYEIIFDLYIRQNLTGVETANKLDISQIAVKKAIARWDLQQIKKKIYGKIKGKKVFLENFDFDQYYNPELF